MKPPERHLPFFSLLDAVRSGEGCFLCRLTRNRAERQIGEILHESVTDPGFRKRWRESRGLCRRHAWMLADSADVLGIAILYLDLINVGKERLLDEPAGEHCLLCEGEARALKDYLHILVSHWHDAELRAALEEGDGLCGPHYRAANRMIGSEEIRDALRRISLGHSDRIGNDLCRLVDGFDYRHEPVTEERVKTAWKRAIRQIVGDRNGRENEQK